MDTATTQRRWTGAAGLVAAGAVAGVILAGTLAANAGDATPNGAGSSTTQEHRGEEPLTGITRTQVEKAVLAEYPDATIERTETDSAGVYESHIRSAEGDRLIVQVGSDFSVTGTETGRGHR